MFKEYFSKVKKLKFHYDIAYYHLESFEKITLEYI